MPSIERCSVQPAGSPARSLARAERAAREARQRGLRAGNAGRPAVGARYVRAGLVELGWTEADQLPDCQLVPRAHHGIAARLLIILAALEAEQGRTDYGLRLLDRAEALVATADRGVLLAQRGLLLRRAWRSDEALRMLSEAITLLDGDAAETANLVAALMNRGFLHLNAGDVRRARGDLDRCQAVAVAEGMHQIVAKTVHNLGYCDLLAGDIPAALQLFTAAADSYRLSAPGNLPVLAMDKARALLAVGLAEDAAIELDGAIASFRRQRLDQDLGDAELARAQAALAAGQPDAARRWAAAAQRRFLRQGNDACSALAELIQLRARSASPGNPERPGLPGQPGLPGRIATEALLLARKLRGCGLRNDADTADLLAARGLMMAGRHAEARQQLAAVHRGGSLEVSLLRRLARAELAEHDGRPGAGLAELRAGLATVQARRDRLGSIDLQTGAAALGADLAAAGLRQALDRQSAPLVFAWLERSRAQAFLARPVRPPADPRAAEILAELRQLSYLIRTAELSGARDPAAITRRARLQREIRELSWQATGPGESTGRATLAEIGAAAAASGQSLVGILARDGRMHAVVLRRGAVRLVGLGDFEVATEAARRLNADLDTLAGRRLPARLEAVIRESIRRQTEVLTAEILAPLRSLLGADGVVFVPAGALASIPWSMLPDLRGRPVTVCPSASSWLTAWRSAGAGSMPTGPVQAGTVQAGTVQAGTVQAGTAGAAVRNGLPLLVAGPDLAHANLEVTELAKLYPGCRPLLAETATVNATLRRLDGASLAHLAAHGHHDQENFLFSSLDLADGPLMAYDIQQLAAAPRQVVLSACDVGRTVVRPGEEILGFTAALLYVGTATVIASVARVADDAAVGVMTSYHRALAAGARPARALADAIQTEPFSPFVCFGSG